LSPSEYGIRGGRLFGAGSLSGVAGATSFRWPVRDGLTLLGVVLTFSVSRPDVAARVASQLHLRPFDLATWTLASSAELRPVGFPSGAASLLALHSPSRTSSSNPDLVCEAVFDDRSVQRDLPPLGFDAPKMLPARGIHVPTTAPCSRFPVCPSSRASRRGFPRPRCSAFVVFRDLGGLLLPEPCDLFQPLTSLGFVSRSPRLLPSQQITRGHPARKAWGVGTTRAGSRLTFTSIGTSRRSLRSLCRRRSCCAEAQLVRFRLPELDRSMTLTTCSLAQAVVRWSPGFRCVPRDAS
jgi:hypothetical protein